MPRDKIIMECTDCKSRNYHTTKNKRKHPQRGLLRLGIFSIHKFAGSELVPAFRIFRVTLGQTFEYVPRPIEVSRDKMRRPGFQSKS